MKLSKILKEALSRQGITIQQSRQEISKGHIVLAPFPFSDANEYKIRPCLVLAKNHSGEILCAYMSSNLKSSEGILIKPSDLNWTNEREPATSLLRPDKLATIDLSRVVKMTGHLLPTKRKEIVDRINNLIQ